MGTAAPAVDVLSPAERARRDELDRRLAADLSGARVLTVGPDAEADARALAARGARETVICPGTAAAAATPAWRDLTATSSRRFDLIVCDRVLHTERHPLALLERLHGLLTEEGDLWLGAVILARIELSEYARFVPDRYAGDSGWWWVPGRLTLRWMLDAAGFAVAESFDLEGQPQGEFPVLHTLVRARLGPAVTDAPQPG
jgi:hypothetical protein